MKIAAITVLYNPDEEVFENIKTYIDAVDVVYAIDNSESDNSKMFSQEKIKYLPNHKNLGVAKALNMGAKLATEYGCDWMLTMDQDSRFSDNGVERMKEFISFLDGGGCTPCLFGMTRENVGIVVPFHDTPINPITNPRGFCFEDIVMTSGNMVSLAAYNKIGGYNEDYFIDALDFDFSLNLRNHGFDIIRLNYITLTHGLGNPIFKTFLGKKMYSLNHSYIRRYYIVRNRKYFYDAYKDTFPAFCEAEKRRTSREAIKILLLEKQKFKKLLYMYRGYKDYERGIKGEIPSKYI